ncbi:MAG TPA: glycoside hydrolase family 25 protein [Chthoniobacterales bacterium]|nr:glycoside hydrolase family 25 protein [Chthoniobacterales bacterium]
MKFSFARNFVFLVALSSSAFAGNSVVNMSHYDLMRVDFEQMKREGVVGVIHEATYPPRVRDAYYGPRQTAATRAGLLWGAYHFANATDPIRQAEHFLGVVESSYRGPGIQPSGVLLVLDFEKNGHYPGGTMTVSQAARFVERIKQRTGKYPGVYGSDYRLKAVLNAPGVNQADKAILGNCWLWIANYHHLPTANSPWSNWRLWQYTGDGICDLRPRSTYPIRAANIAKAERNIFRGSNEALAAWWHEHAWVPAD